jgi:hypothetical protein
MAQGGVKDWGHDLQVGLDALADAERAALGELPPPRAFGKYARWLIAPPAPALSSGARADLRTVLRGTGLSPAIGLLRGALPKIAVRSAADVILLKANLRSFYLARRVSLKVANPGRRTGRQRLHHEAQSRSGLRPGKHARVPKLLGALPAAPAGFLAEELVIGRAPRPGDIDVAQLADWLLDFYLANGLGPRRVGELCDAAADWQLLRDYAQRVGLAIAPELIGVMGQVAAAAGRAQARVAAATCNGDLTLTNMILSDGGVVILDWEYACLAPVFFDAVRLTAQLPAFADRFMAAYAGSPLHGQPNMLPVTQQFLVGCTMAAQQRIARVEDFEFAGDRAAYDARLRGRIAKILQLMARLAGRA